MTILEICVEGYAGAKAAAAGGADRVELCSRLDLGGITPTIADLRKTLQLSLPAGVAVMIRPRGGDFRYTQAEVTRMCQYAASVAALVESLDSDPNRIQLVTGAQLARGDLDCNALEQIKRAGGGLTMVCHRAFDETPDLHASLQALADLGFARVLTAGGPKTRAQTTAQRSLIAANSGVEILICGGVRPHNLAAVMAATGASQVHMRAPYRDDDPGTDPSVVAAAQTILRDL